MSPARRQLLLKAVMAGAGEGWRTPWLAQLAADSDRFGWTIDEAQAAVADDVEWVNAAKAYTPNSAGNAIRDGLLAAHPAVRGHFPRLSAIIDEVVATQKNLVNATVQRRYHGLQELMRLQLKPSRRCHAVSDAAYTAYLQERRAAKLAKAKRSVEPSMSPPDQPREQAGVSKSVSATAAHLETFRTALIYELESIVQKSSQTGISIQRLIDAAVQNFLR